MPFHVKNSVLTITFVLYLTHLYFMSQGTIFPVTQKAARPHLYGDGLAAYFRVIRRLRYYYFFTLNAAIPG